MRENGGLVAAFILGLIVVSAYLGHAVTSLGDPEQERYPAYYNYPIQDRNIETTLAGQSEISNRKQPCRNPEGREESDLCAQWKAANAARDNVIWTERHFWISIITALGLGVTILLTFRAVRSSEDALEHARETAKSELRAWIRLGVQPTLVRHLGDGRLHLRATFTAENTGKTPATHFAFVHKIFFWQEEGDEDGGDRVRELIQAQLAEWRADYNFAAILSLLPNDNEQSPVWQTFSKKDWETRALIANASIPMMLSAVFYRTVSDPNTVQMSWRTWYLESIDQEGHRWNRVPLRDEDYGPDDLCAETFYRSLVHEEYKFEGDEKKAQGI